MPFDCLSEPMIVPVEDSDEVRLLVRARERLERGWCKYSLAQARYFIPVSTHSRFARRFCSIGALNRTAEEIGISADRAECLIVAVTGWDSIMQWNDMSHRTKADVLNAFDNAIALGRGRQVTLPSHSL